jgi:hypothetical protein
MAKGGFLSALPFLAAPAALATGGLLAPALFGAEAAGGAALGAGEAATAGALPSAEALLAAPATAELGTAVSTPLTAGAVSGLTDAAISGLPDAVSGLGGTTGGGLSAGLESAIPTATQAIGDFTGGTVGAGNAFGLPTGTQVGGETLLGATSGVNDPAGSIAPFGRDAGISDLLSGESDVFGEEQKSLFDKATEAVTGPIGKLGLAGGGLLASTLMNTGTVPGSAPLTSAAKTATTAGANLLGQANQNLGALNTGALPAGTQSAIDQAARSAKATIRSQYAGMGLGHSTSEAQALAAVDQQAGVQRLKAAEDLTTLGLKEAGLAGQQQALASEDYLALLNAQTKQDDRLAQALARFSGSLAGGAASQL